MDETIPTETSLSSTVARMNEVTVRAAIRESSPRLLSPYWTPYYPGGCVVMPDPDYSNQFELSGGIILRF
jgi:hypothetical protein